MRGWGSGGGCVVSPRPSPPPAHGHSLLHALPAAPPPPSLPPPLQVNDTVMLDLETGKISSFVKFDVGNLAMVTGGHNNGRVGTILNKEKHKGSFDIVNIKDAGGCGVLRRGWPARAGRGAFLIGCSTAPCRAVSAARSPRPPRLPVPAVSAAAGHTFATRMTNVFVIGRGDKPLISLPKGKGIRQSILQEQAKLYGKAQA